MKKNSLSIIGILIVLFLQANARPEPVPSKITEIKSKFWYQEAFDKWKSYLRDNESDKQGWLEYFRAAQFINSSPEELLTIRDQIGKLFPESFEYFLVQSKLSGWTMDGVENLERALKLAKQSDSFLEEKVCIAELRLDGSRLQYSRQLFESNLIRRSTLSYAYNVLMSVGDNGILFTDAIHSTIPLWVLQDVMDIRKDVSVINFELSQNESYLEAKLANCQINGEDGSFTNIPINNSERSFYYALTVPRQKLVELDDRLYVVGLTSRFEPEDLDNISILKENIEKRFLLDYLTIDFDGEPNSSTGKVLEQNYIVPFLLLKQYYDENGEVKEATFLKELILKIANESEVKGKVERLIDSGVNFKKVTIDVKALDKKLKKVKGNLYASNIEVSNREFWPYMDYLHNYGPEDLYKASLVDLSKYDDVTAAFMENYHYNPVNMEVTKVRAKWIDKYFDYPAVDMTYETAKAYCEWLTFQYNRQEGRRFKRVKFRLPTQKEWTMAALGYQDFQSWNLKENKIQEYSNWSKNKKEGPVYDLASYEVSYPWGMMDFARRNSIQNELGCYLANVRVEKDITCPAGLKGDGFTLMSPVATYFSNGLGLYDVVGNVAEMTDENGQAMGGSWNHSPEESTITSVNQYEVSDPSVGFRLFMEVIEE